MECTTDYEHVWYIDKGIKDLADTGYTTPGYYFWDETDAYCYGPYDTPEIANEKLIEYARILQYGY